MVSIIHIMCATFEIGFALSLPTAVSSESVLCLYSLCFNQDPKVNHAQNLGESFCVVPPTLITYVTTIFARLSIPELQFVFPPSSETVPYCFIPHTYLFEKCPRGKLSVNVKFILYTTFLSIILVLCYQLFDISKEFFNFIFVIYIIQLYSCL